MTNQANQIYIAVNDAVNDVVSVSYDVWNKDVFYDIHGVSDIIESSIRSAIYDKF